MIVKEISFSELRQAYLEIQSFLEDKIGCDIDSLAFKIEKEGQIIGDDISELLYRFSKKFDIDFEGFNFEEHFHSEEEAGFFPIAVLFWLLSVIISGGLELICQCFGKKENFGRFAIEQRAIKDLTFGDLLTSFLEKKFTYRNQVKYILANTPQ